MNDYDRAHQDLAHTFRWARALNWITAALFVVGIIVLAVVNR